jgi:pSer/pThr/pTyr-binding forkhead associated (FHA) protein
VSLIFWRKTVDYCLAIFESNSEVQRVALKNGENLIGRADGDSEALPDIDLSKYDHESKVSRKHALIRVQGEKIVLEDLGSRNGTVLKNGESLKVGSAQSIKVGEEFLVGKILLRVCESGK